MSAATPSCDDTSVTWQSLRRAAVTRGPQVTPPPGLRWNGQEWEPEEALPPASRACFDLYLPVCNGGQTRPFVLGHLGQSIDGFIATHAGESQCVTGTENIRHLHRLRALCDAILVGAGTVAADDPQLTTRLVDGPNPLRVVLDPRRRLRADHRLFSDGAAPTLRVIAAPAGGVTQEPAPSEIPELYVPRREDGRLDLQALVAALHARGCRRLFVEGGGATVSGFLEAGLLDRLHVAISPLIIGSGRPAIRLASRERLGDCLRPPARLYRMGADVLYDFDLRGGAPAAPLPREEIVRLY